MASDLGVTVNKGSGWAQAATFEPGEDRFEKTLNDFYTALISILPEKGDVT